MEHPGNFLSHIMLEVLKFVRAALSKEDTRPHLRHFKISGGRIIASNGRLAICHPLALDLPPCCPHGEQFYKAIAACEDAPQFYFEAGRLVVRSGRLKVNVPLCDPEIWPEIYPAGQLLPITSPILPILERLLPFVSTDETRPWLQAIKFINQSAYATNNIMVAEHFIPANFPVACTLPVVAVDELIRLRLEPSSVQAEAHKVTFHLPGGAWLASVITADRWPDLAGLITESESYTGPWMEGEPLATLLADCRKLYPFVDDARRIAFRSGKLITLHKDGPGASLDCPASPGTGCFNTVELSALAGVAKVGWNNYPKAVPFRGPGFRGVMAGLVDTEST